MNPELLTAISGARGAALDARKALTPVERAEAARWFTPGRGGGDGQVRWNLPKGDRVRRPIEWSHAETAMACRGLGEKYFNALRFEYALDDSVLWSLRRALIDWAEREARLEADRREQARKQRRGQGPELWSHQVRERLARMAEVLLLERRAPWRFAGSLGDENDDGEPRRGRPPNLRRVLLGVEDRNCWQRKVAPAYEAMHEEWLRWLAVGCAHMRRRLYEWTG